MTPGAQKIVERVRCGQVLTMHYRRETADEVVARFVLEPSGRVVRRPSAESAIASGELVPGADGLFAETPQTWRTAP